MTDVETDYLVVGAGASGMGFTDTLIANSDVDVILVDRRHRPGGHWNQGYGFLRLHQPSAFYGVNSRPLGNDRIDLVGPNAGLYERASGAEVCDYYGRVLDEQMLPSGKVRFFGMSDYIGDGNGEHRFVSRLTGKQTTVRVRRKLVDATYIQTTIGPNNKPSFSTDPGARMVIPHDLVSVADHGSGFTIIGAGKTAMDTCCWLIDQGVAPDHIRWIRPREPWGVDRKGVQPLTLMGWFVEAFAFQLEAAAQAESADDFMRRLEDGGVHVRLDTTVDPEIARGPTLSRIEVEALRSIENVVRLGRVLNVGASEITLERGSIATEPRQIHVDCSAPGLGLPPVRPIFDRGVIYVQRVMNAIDAFSSAMIGFVEATREDDEEKNRLCRAVEFSGLAREWPDRFLKSQKARVVWFADPDVREWLARTRLTPMHRAMEYLTDPASQAAVGRMIANTGPAIENLERLLGAGN